MINQFLKFFAHTCAVRRLILNSSNNSRLYHRLCLSGASEIKYILSLRIRRLIKHQKINSFDLKSPVLKFYSMNSSDNINVNYSQLIQFLKDKVVVIDVREKEELKETGEIPGSFNIPLGDVGKALTLLNDDDFKKTYGFPKPAKDEIVIFSCRSGKRSLMAHTEALKAGYIKALNFSGGWLEWEENFKKSK